MKTQEIFKKVGSIISEINEQYQYLTESPENLNDLELELLSANADFLAEHIKVLKKLNTVSEQKALTEASNANSVAQNEGESISMSSAEEEEPVVKSGPESYFSFSEATDQNASTPQIETREVYELTPQEYEIIEPENAEDEVVPEDERDFIEDSPARVYEGDDIQDDELEITINEPDDDLEELTVLSSAEPHKAPTLNELIAAQRAQSSSSRNSVTGRINRQSVTDLKAIINLNDKLLFIKDLFNGYSLAYSEAIEILNRFDSFDAADNFLKTNYAAKNNWAARQGTADKFYELLNRRFSK